MEATKKINDMQRKMLSPPRDLSIESEDNESVI
jgi:hypothetical protein